MNADVYTGGKQVLILLSAFSLNIAAQEAVPVDSIDLNTGVIYPANSMETVDTVCCDTIECTNPSIPQIPFGELDSLTMHNLDARYAVVWKDGKCGIYDFRTEKNVTRIEYSALRFSFRKEFEGEYYTYFAWDEKEKYGVVGVSENTNEFVAISFPRKQVKETEEEKKQ